MIMSYCRDVYISMLFKEIKVYQYRQEEHHKALSQYTITRYVRSDRMYVA